MNANLSPFIFAQDASKNLIIDTQHLIVAQIITGPNQYWKERTIIIPHYHIGIVYLTSIGAKEPNTEDILFSLNIMKDFFIAEKLLKNEKYYNRFKDYYFKTGDNKKVYELNFLNIYYE